MSFTRLSVIAKEKVFYQNLFNITAQAIKRTFSSLNHSDRGKSRSQDGIPSPKRQKYSLSKNSIDRAKVEGNSCPRVDQHGSRRSSPIKSEHSGMMEARILN